MIDSSFEVILCYKAHPGKEINDSGSEFPGTSDFISSACPSASRRSFAVGSYRLTVLKTSILRTPRGTTCYGQGREVWEGKYGVRHNNLYRLDANARFLLLVESWPVVPECSQPVCSITSLSAATNGERRFDTMTITELTSTD
jgi:hypothetical protein